MGNTREPHRHLCVDGAVLRIKRGDCLMCVKCENERLITALATANTRAEAERMNREQQSESCAKLLSERDAEIERLRAALMEAAVDLDTIMERRDGELTGSAWGDVDNVRLDVLLAAKKEKRPCG